MSIYEASITNPKKQLEFYKALSEQLQRENERLKNNNKILNIQKEETYKIADDYYKENKQLKDRIDKTNNLINTILNLDYDKFCNYDTYINSIIEIREELSGEKDV